MGRLIDVDKIQFDLIDEVGGEYNPYLGCSKSQIDDLPTVEAIPKADYEEQIKINNKLVKDNKQLGAYITMMQVDYNLRLKADMVAVLTDIQLELDEMKITKVRSAGFAPYSKDPFRRGINCSKEIIQQKINSLKENKDGNDKERIY